jgi:hypothetical protein
MPRHGSAILDDLQFAGFERLEVTCPICSRQGEYSVQALIAAHGYEYGLTKFLHDITRDCPKRLAGAFADQCAAECPQLRRAG